MYKDQISSHLSPLLDPDNGQWLMEQIIADLKQVKQQFPFDAIAVKGHSGTLLAGLLSYHLSTNIIIVRDPSTKVKHRNSLSVEGPMDGSYLIVDDLIFLGSTINDIQHYIYTSLCEHSECVGVYLYNSRLSSKGKTCEEIDIHREQHKQGGRVLTEPNEWDNTILDFGATWK